jgi:hypothetical protein
MKNYVQWGNKTEDWPVLIKGEKGKNEAFKSLDVEKKGSELKILGIVIDADDSAQATWDKVAGYCRKYGVEPPAICPKSGYITPLDSIKFGAWVMPNNELEGMLEHFCHELVPPEAEVLWAYAEEAAREAKNKGAVFSDLHMPKAHIRTWLAWQETPGIQMGSAISGKMLRHQSASADSFVQWFLDLFELTPKPADADRPE